MYSLRLFSKRLFVKKLGREQKRGLKGGGGGGHWVFRQQTRLETLVTQATLLMDLACNVIPGCIAV